MYREYGVFAHTQHSFTFEGASGMKKMDDIMTSLRNNIPDKISGYKVEGFDDYQTRISKNILTGGTSNIDLPESNVLAFRLSDGAGVIIRPSGTEPKIKAYYTTTGKTEAEAYEYNKKLDYDFTKLIGC